MLARLITLPLTALITGVACAPSPPPGDQPESLSDSAELCLDGDELRAVFDSCASSCDDVIEASCTVEEGSVSTLYEVQHPAANMDCTTDCRLHDASCGTPEGSTVAYDGDDVALSDLPACSEL